MQHAGFENAQDALAFIFAGNAVFTLTSTKTDKHFTYKMRQGNDDTAPHFLSVLSGPDNWANYQYIGFVPFKAPATLVAGRNGKPDALSYKVFRWALSHLQAGNMPSDLTIQHEGKCARCARRLTHPDSIARGIGPECATKMGKERR